MGNTLGRINWIENISIVCKFLLNLVPIIGPLINCIWAWCQGNNKEALGHLKRCGRQTTIAIATFFLANSMWAAVVWGIVIGQGINLIAAISEWFLNGTWDWSHFAIAEFLKTFQEGRSWRDFGITFLMAVCEVVGDANSGVLGYKLRLKFNEWKRAQLEKQSFVRKYYGKTYEEIKSDENFVKLDNKTNPGGSNGGRPLGEEVYINDKESLVLKTNQTGQRAGSYGLAESYEKAHKMGVGPKCMTVDDNTVLMEKGISLNTALDNGTIMEEDAIKQLEGIQKILKANHVAHTDIKLENLCVINGEVKAIDVGDLTNYGSIRSLSTPGVNSTCITKCNPGQMRHVVGDSTDCAGFKNVIARIRGQI